MLKLDFSKVSGRNDFFIKVPKDVAVILGINPDNHEAKAEISTDQKLTIKIVEKKLGAEELQK